MFGWLDTHPELQLVGHITHNPKSVHRAIEAGIEASYFETTLGKAMWETIAKIHAAGHEPDFDSVGMKLPKELRGEYGDASKNFPITSNFEFHLEEFLNHAAKRKAQQVATTGPLDPVENAKAVHDAMQKITSGLKPQKSMVDIAKVWVAEKYAALAGETKSLLTHISALNELNPRGFAPGAMYVLAARPGTGKTTLAISFASHICKTDRVVFATIEMPANEILSRFIAIRSKVPYAKLDLSQNENDRMMWAVKTLTTETPLNIIDDWQGRWDKLEAKLTRAMHESKPPKLIVIDHLALMKFDSKTRDQITNLSEITGAIKRFAVTHQVAILLCSQMNRGIEQEQGRLPRLSDLRGSGTIEQDADVVMFIHHDTKTNQYQLLLAKNRHGQAHKVVHLAVDFSISLMTGDQDA